MSVQIDWNVAGDADLVGAAIAGDRAAFAGIYDRYADRLYDFCVGMVGASDAADCVQEAFCQAAVALSTLRDPDKLRPWLYSIVRHQALRVLRARKRELTSDELPEEPSEDAGPDVVAARNELAELVAQAEGGLTDRDRDVLNLAYRHGLTGSELAVALDVSNESAKKMVQLGLGVALLLVSLLGVVLLAKKFSLVVDAAIAGVGAPPALAGVLVALLILLPEGVAALAAARSNDLQKSINLALGSSLATIGLTIPAVAAAAHLLDKELVLGLNAPEMVLLALTFILSMLTFGTGRTNILFGLVHMVVFAVFVFMVFVP